MQRVPEDEGLLGGEEEVGTGGAGLAGGGRGAVSAHRARRPVAEDRGGAPDRVGDAGHQVGPVVPLPPAVSRTSSAATVTASTGGADNGAPARRGVPKRCRPVGDQ